MINLLYDKWFLNNPLPNCLDIDVINFVFENYNDTIPLNEFSFQLEKKFGVKHNLWKSNIGLKTIQLQEIQNLDTIFFYPIEPWGHLMYSLNVEAKDDYTNFFEKIPKKVIKYINEGNGKIVINYSHEGWVNDWALKGFYLGAKNNQIDLNKIILILNDFNLKNKLEKFKEKYDIENYPKIINYSFFLTASAKHFYEKYKINNTEKYEFFKKNKKYKFLFLNRRLDTHRVKLMCEIYNLIKDNSIISFDKSLITNEVENFIKNYNLLQKFDYIPNKIVADREDIENTNGYKHENNLLFLDTQISIVTETSFYSDNDFISEKIWRPLFQYHPFIVVGRPYLLKYLKEIGFKTFDWLINEEYDNIEDNDKRMQFIIYEIEKLNKLSNEEIQTKINQNFDILTHNHELLTTIGTKVFDIEKYLIETIKSDFDYIDIYKNNNKFYNDEKSIEKTSEHLQNMEVKKRI